MKVLAIFDHRVENFYCEVCGHLLILKYIFRYGHIVFYVTVFIAIMVHLIFDTAENRYRLIPLLGLVFFLLVGFVTSSNRKAVRSGKMKNLLFLVVICNFLQIKWRTVIWGLLLQYLFGLLTIRWEVGRDILQCLGDKVNIFLNYAFEGASFAYGDSLVKVSGVFAFKVRSVHIYYLTNKC